MNLCVIPARGGSKRIPKKNIRKFCGKPIIAYSIECAINSGLFDKIIVSTDDEEIASVARTYGAEVPFIRPEKLSDDYTGTNEVIKHAICWYESKGYSVSYVCCLYATAPFVKNKFIKEAYEKLLKSENSFAFSVTSFSFPIQRALKIMPNGNVDAVWSENIFKRSQDLEERYHDAGQFYWGKKEAFINEDIVFSPVSIPIILPRYLVQDIDTLEDWYRAELMYSAWQLGKIEK